MELISHPSDPRLMALDINDSIKFLYLHSDTASDEILTRDDFSLQSAALPNLPQPVDTSVVKCMTWCSSNGETVANALAAGLSSGKVVLLWPGDGQVSNKPMYFKNEFIPHLSRACNALSWNESQPNLLAAGMERSRSEQSLVIWDITSDPSSDATNQSQDRVKNYMMDVQNALPHTTSRRSKTSNFTKTYAETCFAEAVNSVAWLRHEASTIIAGVNSKHLRIYDIRNIRSASNVVNTKAVFGICQDPCFDMRLASFYENHMHIWDLRNFTKPAAVVTARYNIIKVEWCPTRCGLLASLSVGASEGRIIRAYDMTHAMVTDSDSDIAYRHIEQIVKPSISEEETIGTFAWCMKNKNVLLAVSSAGALHNVTVHERISLGWTKESGLLSASEDMHLCIEFQNQSVDDDKVENLSIDHIMYKRAINGYGLENSPHFDPLINLEPNNIKLHGLWKWIKATKEHAADTQSSQSTVQNSVISYRSSMGMLSKNPQLVKPVQNRFSGLQSQLAIQNQSECEFIEWIGVPEVKCGIYSSLQRAVALKMCGWHCITDTRIDNAKFKEYLKECDNTERAAALALWHLDMRSAIDILQRNESETSQVDYSVIAMALSGYSGNDVSPLWREMCATLQKTMPSPYLRAGFAFLNAQENGHMKYNEILSTSGVSVQDRAGFACMYLPDDELQNVMEMLSETSAKDGNLDGVIVTGLITDRGVELMQNYVDKTKDVQTAVLAMIQTNYKGILSNLKVSHMLESYRILLNMWMLWKERAKVDISVGAMSMGQRTKQTSQGVFVQCNYCGKSIRNNTRMPIRGRGLLLQSPGMMSKVTSCPNCRKPLPRCSVCCMCLGSSPTDSGELTYPQQSYDVDLDSWFTWCPLCQHGGHAKHLTTWFEQHQDCPLSGCPCKCSNLIVSSDISAMIPNKIS